MRENLKCSITGDSRTTCLSKNKSLIEHKLTHRTGNIFMGISTKLKYDVSLKFFKSIPR